MKKLDVVSNEAFIKSLERSRVVSLMVSEENEEPIIVKDSEGIETQQQPPSLLSLPNPQS